MAVRTVHRIETEAELRSILGGGPTEVVAAKIADRISPLTRRFVEASPFVCLAPERHLTPSSLPSLGEVLREGTPSLDAAAYDSERAGRYARREGLY